MPRSVSFCGVTTESPSACTFPIFTHLKHHCYTQLPHFSKSYHGTKTFSGLPSIRQSRSPGLAFEGPEQPSLRNLLPLGYSLAHYLCVPTQEVLFIISLTLHILFYSSPLLNHSPYLEGTFSFLTLPLKPRPRLAFLISLLHLMGCGLSLSLFNAYSTRSS